MSVPATFNIGEDLLMNQRAANGLRRAVMIPCSIYGYRQREDSAIHVRKVSNSYNKRFYEECIRCIAELPVSDAKKERIRRQYALSNLKCFISAGTVDIDRDFWLSEVRSIRKFSLRGDSPFIMSAIIRLRAQRFRIVRRIPHIPRYLCAVRQAILKMYLALLKK